MPYFREAYHSKLDRGQWGLVEVAQLCNYKGAIWATWDPAAPSFTEYLGDFARYFDLILDGRDGREGQAEVLGGVQKWLIPCNWKFPAENFSGDSYHNISHRSVDLAGIGPSGAGRRDMGELLAGRKLHVCIPDRGHQTIVYALPKDRPQPPTYQHSPVVSEYFRHCDEERRRTRGDEARLLGAPGEIFPNIALLPRQPRTIAVWHPRGPHQTEVWRWFLVDREAPQEVKDFLRDYYIRYSGPAGMTEQDDMENWNYAHQASRGTSPAAIPIPTRWGWAPRSRISNGTGCAFPAGSSTSPRRNRARSRCATSTAAGPSSWKPTAGTSWRRGAIRCLASPKPPSDQRGRPPPGIAMPVAALDDPILKRFRAALDALYGDRIERVVLFGSRARGDAREDSDYDVAVFLIDPSPLSDERHRLADAETDILYVTGAVIHAMPFVAGSYRERTGFMHEVRRDGIDL